MGCGSSTATKQPGDEVEEAYTDDPYGTGNPRLKAGGFASDESASSASFSSGRAADKDKIERRYQNKRLKSDLYGSVGRVASEGTSAAEKQHDKVKDGDQGFVNPVTTGHGSTVAMKGNDICKHGKIIFKCKDCAYTSQAQQAKLAQRMSESDIKKGMSLQQSSKDAAKKALSKK